MSNYVCLTDIERQVLYIDHVGVGRLVDARIIARRHGAGAEDVVQCHALLRNTLSRRELSRHSKWQACTPVISCMSCLGAVRASA